jgi:hypothetical protein
MEFQRAQQELDEMLDGMGSADYTSSTNTSDIDDDGTSLFLASGGDEEKNEEKHEKKAKKDMLPRPISFIYSFILLVLLFGQAAQEGDEGLEGEEG